MAALVCAASDSSSSPSLPDLQTLGQSTSRAISPDCSAAYDLSIPGCTLGELMWGAGCSSSCEMGLGAVEQTIQVMCGSVEVRADTDTLLAEALAGHLVRTLCGTCRGRSGCRNGSSTSREVQSFTTIPTSTAVVVQTPPQPSSTQVSTSSTEAPVLPPSTPAETQSRSRPPPPPSSSTTTATATATQITMSAVISAAASLTATSTTSSKKAGSTPDNDGRGGGSPFDSVSAAQENEAARLGPVLSAQLVALGLGWIPLLLR